MPKMRLAMARSEVDFQLAKIDDLVVQINALVPSENYQAIQFRADLAGLLVVAIASTYENCVKEILYQNALRHHQVFGDFANRNFGKLNSKIRVSDLKKYCDLYGVDVGFGFSQILKKRKKLILDRIGKNVEASYNQILDWRHDFAHAGVRNTTIEEAAATHKLGKRIIYIFDEAMAL